MRWPWQQPKAETRSGYTGTILSALLAEAETGGPRQPRGLAAVEQAAGLWQRAFASADVSGGVAAVSPEFLGLVGRELIRSGEAVFRIAVEGGQVRLYPQASVTITGGSDPEGWTYLGTENGPSTAQTWTLPAAAVLHFRYGVDIARPFHGVAPWSFAGVSSTLAANLEARLGDEAGAPVGSLFPIPQNPKPPDSDDDPLADLRADIAKAKGHPLLVETTASGWGDGKGAAPLSDWKARRFGADPPAALEALRGASGADITAACGVPAALAGEGDGTAKREAYRQFVALSVRPMARLVEAELSAKLERDIGLDFSDLRSDDLSGRARAFQSLVKGGMEVSPAAALAGLMLED